MFVRLLLLLTIVPFVELTILLQIADRFRWGPTISLVILTGILGAWLARREGLKAIARIQADLSAGVPPAGAVLDGALILAAGLVLVTPGILTDLCGFALLIPPIRARVRRRLTEALKKRIVVVGPDDRGTFVDVTPTSSRDSSHSRDVLFGPNRGSDDGADA